MLTTGQRLFQAPRWGLLVVALLLGLTLTGTTLHGMLSARALARTVAQGQAEDLLQRLLPRDGDHHGPPTLEQLEAALSELEPRGLRYLAMVGPGGRVQLEAGKGSGAAIVPPPGQVVFVGEVARVAAQPPPPPPLPLGYGLPPPGHGPPPRMVMEFEPTLAMGLVDRAQLSFAIGLLVAMVLMIAAVVLWRQLRRAERTAVAFAQQRHLAALGEMSAVLAHEIRNPLAALKGHAQLLGESLADGDRPHERAQVVVDHAVRLERLTNELLEFARTGAVTRTPVDPRRLVGDAAAELDDRRLEIHLDDAPSSWSLDGPRMERVVANLLDNALQASPEDGIVEVALTSDAGVLELSVRDHGDGLPDDDPQRIFEPFHGSSTGGTGLGLAVVQRIVQLHGGSVAADDAPGGGARFRVTIPADDRTE